MPLRRSIREFVNISGKNVTIMLMNKTQLDLHRGIKRSKTRAIIKEPEPANEN